MNNRNIIIAVIVAAIVVAGVAIFFLTRTEPTVLPSTEAPTIPGAPSAPPATSETPTPPPSAGSELMQAGPLGEKALGDPNAPVTIIEYASMTCSHCAQFANTVYRDLKTKYIDTGKVRYILREFPLDSLAVGAVMLARCAPNDGYFPLVELLFEHQRDWAFVEKPLDALFALVRQAGFTQESFRACLANQQILDGITDVRNRGDKLGVDGTPTFFINGQKHTADEIQTIGELDKIIEPLLN
jgi:protein-disulfide isomerase